MASIRYWGYNIAFGVGMMALAYFNSVFIAQLLLTFVACFAFFQAGVIAQVSKGDIAPSVYNARMWMWINGWGSVLYSYLFLTSSTFVGATMNTALVAANAWVWGMSWQRHRTEQRIIRSRPPGRDAEA